jgi:hypothetical protein
MISFNMSVSLGLPTALTGVPHATSREDEYLGYKIPERATVFFNASLQLSKGKTALIDAYRHGQSTTLWTAPESSTHCGTLTTHPDLKSQRSIQIPTNEIITRSVQEEGFVQAFILLIGVYSLQLPSYYGDSGLSLSMTVLESHCQ